ncbi:phytoene desaturase family protein [Gracilibacillus kekensis]|uniref:Phytoene dehydrogenase-related protein n=1 Tax=Gracilibacillus kekensis TaxID=1027249 RepID=A0A1M7L5K9_9BACI|nr:FAD-dependent oxidoreductase [Gracilibacillus kekensis]SHM73217.1 Phytoene dehydrogenase-related protein [Gracilibacillus kekensis]
MTNKWDVVIIGGGLAGYVAANYLAKNDLSVLILEKAGSIGGRARTNKMKQQLFNIGPHALYKKGKAISILEELGINISGKSPKLGGVLIKDEVEYAAPLNLSALFSSQLLKGKEKMEWLSMIMKIKNINVEKLTDQSYKDWVEQVTKSPTIKSLLFVLARLSTYCHPPDITSAKVILSHVKVSMDGVLYIDYGWQTIIDQLHNKAIISGVDVQTNVVVTKMIKDEDDDYKLISSQGDIFPGKYVISTTGPSELNAMLGNDKSLPKDNFFEEIIPVKGATLDVALTQLPNPKQLFAMGITDPLYYAVHSPYAILSENRNHSILHVFKYLLPDEKTEDKDLKTELELFLEKLQPGWKNFAITSRFIPHIVVNQRFPQTGDNQRLYQLKNKFSGLYIASDWASPHFILSEAATTSAKQAVEEIIIKEEESINANHYRRLSRI